MERLRKVVKITKGVPAVDGAGVKLVRVIGYNDTKEYDPFLMLDAFDSDSFAKAYVFTMLPMYVIAVLILFLSKKTNFISNLGQDILFFTDNQVLIPIFGILIGLILLTISALISNLIYTRKEI